MARREANESARTKGRVICRTAAPHCVESNKLREDSQLHADMMPAVRAGETQGIIMTAQSIKEDGQKQTQRRTDGQPEWGSGKNVNIDKEADNDGVAAESNDSQGWRCPLGGVSLREDCNQSQSAHTDHRRMAGR